MLSLPELAARWPAGFLHPMVPDPLRGFRTCIKQPFWSPLLPRTVGRPAIHAFAALKEEIQPYGSLAQRPTGRPDSDMLVIRSREGYRLCEYLTGLRPADAHP